ncbi:MAG: hypothetical protein QOH41_3242 [Blastocatellia bacterium]|jgi:hypothetical protein|nr:hypothetical protein [Blastocatellia bacterium]
MLPIDEWRNKNRKLSPFSHDAGRLCLARLVKLQIVDPNQLRHAESNTTRR